MTKPVRIDDAFLSLSLRDAAEAALDYASTAGASWADIRIERQLSNGVYMRDLIPETRYDNSSVGLGVRVIVDGCWGFASDPVISREGAVRAARKAIDLARLSAPLNTRPATMASEPVIGTAAWSSEWEIDPFQVPVAERIDVLRQMSQRILGGKVDHVDASAVSAKEQKFYADLTGNRLTSQRLYTEASVTGTHIDPATGRFTTLRTLAGPMARGWESMLGKSYDWETELEQLPELLAMKAAAPSVTPGRYDLVIDPTNLWLTIHETIGHATELDRVLGYEANYAGTSFATQEKLGTFRYGSPLLNVTAERLRDHGLSTVGWDDEGVRAQSWPLISDGILVGYQTDRSTAALVGLERSNGSAYADSPEHVPLQRMPNISVEPAVDGPSLDDLIGSVENGLLVKGDDSWSIDMQRHNFQFTGQQFWRIRDGKLDGMVSDAAYQGNTTQFWNSLKAVGNADTFVLGGASNCGKGQPGQSAPVSHGAPACLFENINVLNTAESESNA